MNLFLSFESRKKRDCLTCKAVSEVCCKLARLVRDFPSCQEKAKSLIGQLKDALVEAARDVCIEMYTFCLLFWECSIGSPDSRAFDICRWELLRLG